MKGPAYLLLLILSLAAGIAGVVTLIPFAGATYPNVLGYRSVCTFSPAGSLFCFSIAGTSCIIRAAWIKRKAMYGQTRVHRTPVVVVALILLLALGSTGWFLVIDSR
jgi:hypothetical protein